MKILILTLFFIFTSSFNLFPQWSTDPNNNLVIGYGLNPELCSDSAGGCYITYEAGYPAELYLHRVDKYGYQPWGDKRIIAGELEEQKSAKIIEDGEGGVIVSYGDHILHDSYRLRIQKVDSSGNLLWGSTGQRVSLVDTGQSVQRLVTDGDGGCVIVWMESNFGFAEYRINRIDRNGQRVWSNSGIYIQSNYNYSPPNLVRASDGNYYLQISTILYRISHNGQIIRKDSVTLGYPVADPEGGVVLSGRVGTINNRRLVAQRKDSIGNNLWQEPYVEIADSLGLGSFRIGINYRIVNYAWLGTYNGQTDRPFFQAINMDGNIVYQNKILLSEYPSGTTLIGIISSYYNNTIFSWSVSGEINSIFAQMYDTLGNKTWSENGVIIAHPRMTNQQYTTDGRGGLVAGGTINEFTIVAQQVSINGNLGEIVTSIMEDYEEALPLETILYQNYPNPFNSSTIIRYEIPIAEKVRINLYNILGEKILTLFEGEQSSGYHQIILSSDGLSSGIYFYSLETTSSRQINKLTIIK